jgi:hypothetical protein
MEPGERATGGAPRAGPAAGLRKDKKKPQLMLGLASLIAVITLRHLLREEKQGTTASRLSSKINSIRFLSLRGHIQTLRAVPRIAAPTAAP